MFRACSALSGETLAILDAEEVEGKLVKDLKHGLVVW